MSPASLLKNVRPMGVASTDMLIRDGRFAAFGTHLVTDPGVPSSRAAER